MKTPKLLSLGFAAIAVASIAAGSLIFVDGSDTSASALGLTDSQVNSIAANVAATPAEDREAYLQKIATALGVDLAKLKEAIATANVQTLDEQVADGTITQEHADEMRERLASGDTFFFGGRGPGSPGHGHGGPGAGVSGEELAAFLGIDVATLRTEQATKSLATIATEHGKSVDALKSFLTSELTNSLAERVAAGDITQAQADEKLAELTANLDAKVNEIHAPGLKGPRGPRPGGPMPPTTTSASPVS